VRTWEGWGERSAEQNRTLREALFERCDQYDGYLFYVDDEPVGWCQAGPRDRLEKLARQFNLEPDPDTWALTCFLIAPRARGQGMAASLLAGVLDDLRARGVKRVEAFPKRGESLDAGDLWNGPEALFRAAGFAVVRDDPVRPVWRCTCCENGTQLTRIIGLFSSAFCFQEPPAGLAPPLNPLPSRAREGKPLRVGLPFPYLGWGKGSGDRGLIRRSR
jgi:GNAT superfamily N-acetyltransferase